MKFRLNTLSFIRPFDEGGEGGSEGGEGKSADGGEGKSAEGSGSEGLEARVAELEKGIEGADASKPLAERMDFIEGAMKDARKDAAAKRVKLKESEKAQDEFRKGLAKLLGIEDKEESPEALKEKLETTTGENRALKIRSAFGRIAKEVGADEELSWALIATDQGFVTNLDVESRESLEAGLKPKLEELVKANPKLKAGPGVPGTSGTEIKGGTQGRTFTRAEIEAMSPDEINEHFDEISEQMAAGKIK